MFVACLCPCLTVKEPMGGAGGVGGAGGTGGAGAAVGVGGAGEAGRPECYRWRDGSKDLVPQESLFPHSSFHSLFICWWPVTVNVAYCSILCVCARVCCVCGASAETQNLAVWSRIIILIMMPRLTVVLPRRPSHTPVTAESVCSTPWGPEYLRHKVKTLCHLRCVCGQGSEVRGQGRPKMSNMRNVEYSWGFGPKRHLLLWLSTW